MKILKVILSVLLTASLKSQTVFDLDIYQIAINNVNKRIERLFMAGPIF